MALRAASFGAIPLRYGVCTPSTTTIASSTTRRLPGRGPTSKVVLIESRIAGTGQTCRRAKPGTASHRNQCGPPVLPRTGTPQGASKIAITRVRQLPHASLTGNVWSTISHKRHFGKAVLHQGHQLADALRSLKRVRAGQPGDGNNCGGLPFSGWIVL